MKRVKKVWGKEVWIVNCKEYCGKFLYVNQGAESSYHKHLKKKETFILLGEGQARLTIEGKNYMLKPGSRPKTIEPGQLHKFKGITFAVILEISTHHSEKDVVRLTESKGAK